MPQYLTRLRTDFAIGFFSLASEFLRLYFTGMDDVTAYLSRRREMIRAAGRHIDKTPLLEIGCGSGFAVEVLQPHRSQSLFIALDHEHQRLLVLREKQLPMVFPIVADALHPPITPMSIGSVLLFNTLHELASRDHFSIDLFLAEMAIMLRPGGRIIIQDILPPEPAPVTLAISSGKQQRRLEQFRDCFRFRDVRMITTGEAVIMDIKDAVEFVLKSTAPSEVAWLAELSESHFILEESILRDAALKTDLTVSSYRQIKNVREIPLKRRGIATDTVYSETWFEMVLQKSRL